MKQTVIANWKMHKLNSEVAEFFADLQKNTSNLNQTSTYIAPPFTLIAEVAKQAKKFGIGVFAQNTHYAMSGAFTGEISLPMLVELGVCGVIIGHSERRWIFAEDDELINKKIRACQANDLTVVLCIGESEQEREHGETFAVLKRQLEAGLQETKNNGIIIAYEPIWAIGTGKVASIEQVQEVHRYLREFCQERSSDMPIIYGGSVNPENASGLLGLENVDGVLVGGASLTGSTLAKIISSARKKNK